jgi:hypothetical protein
MNKPNAIHMKDVPDDVLKFILKIQGEVKTTKCIKQYSMELTIYKLLREHRDYKKI